VIQRSEIYFTFSAENFSLLTVIEARFHAINECNYSNKLNVGEFGLERDLYTHWDVLAKRTRRSRHNSKAYFAVTQRSRSTNIFLLVLRL